MRASWYAAANACAAPLIRDVSIALVRFGMDKPPTIKMIATTTTSSAKVKPDCEATTSLDLGVDFTFRVPSPFQTFTQKLLSTTSTSQLDVQVRDRSQTLVWSNPKFTVN